MAVGGVALGQTAPYLESLATAYSAARTIFRTIEKVRTYLSSVPTSGVTPVGHMISSSLATNNQL